MDLRQRIADLMPGARAELAELVAIRSVADPRQFPAEECERAAQWVREKFIDVGFSDAHLAETSDGSKAVVGSRTCADPDARTVLLYAHYDVQPPLDDAAWRTPPFELTEVGARWYGRGAADCKGNIVMHLAALRALGDAVGVHLKLVVEGSEEQGTGGLEAFVVADPDLFRADTILVCDTGNAAVGHPAATVSLRGMVNVVVTVEIEATGSPFEATTDGPAYRAMASAMQEAFGLPMAHLGQGGSIPLCNVFEETYPDAEIILMGVEEPLALIHAPNESVDPTEIASMALTEALFLQRYAAREA